MPLFPAAKFMDSVIGVDMHAVAPIPGIPVHPYVGPIFLWSTPVFPSTNVFINGMPACSVGALGYFFHVPQGVPVPPTPANQGYWQRYRSNIPMVLTLTGLTMLANVAIAGIASLIPKPKSAENFIKDVTGIDTSSRAATWQSIKGMFASYSEWQTWVKLLMPPLPYPGAQGSVAVGSPNVTVNGGALAFVGPLMATSCSDIPIVPNGVTLGFSNVLVGVSFADMLRGLAVKAAQGAIQTGVQKGLDAATRGDKKAAPEPDEHAEEQNNKCDDGSHPVSQATGAAWSAFTDINAPYFRLGRELRSAWCQEDGPFGFGARHDRQFSLSFTPDRAVLTDPDNRRFGFSRGPDGSFNQTIFGWTMRQTDAAHFELRHGGAGTLVFLRRQDDAVDSWLLSRTRENVRELFAYNDRGSPRRIRIERSEGEYGRQIGEVLLSYDDRDHIIEISGAAAGADSVRLGTYTYDAAGCLICFTDALGGKWGYAFDEAHRMVRETNPNGYSFHYRYDSEGRCMHAAGDDGLWQVDLKYAPGRTLMTECDNGLWVYALDEFRTITEIADPYGGKRLRHTAANGRVLAEIDSGGRTMRNLFDPAGRHIGRLDRWGNRWPTPDEAPKLPNPLAHVVPATAQAREWGKAPTLSTAVVRLLPAELLAALNALIPAAPVVEPSEKCDLLGRVIERTNAAGGVECYKYDPAGNRLATIDADGLTQRQEFASWNLCVARAGAAGDVTRYRYTKREKISAITDPGGAVSKYIYDCKDRLTHVTRHDVPRENYRYDTGDRLIEKLDGDGKPLLTFEVGESGLQSKRVLASGEVHSFTYDAFGNITEASTTKASVLMRFAGRRRRLSDLRDGRGVEHEWAADELVATTYFGRFTVRYDTLAAGDTLIHTPVGRPHRITVDAEGNVLRALGNGTHELSRYDAAGRCVGRARWWRGEHTPGEWTNYQYSKAGDLQTVRDSKGGITHYRYDAAHRVTGRDGSQGPCAYSYDVAGNLTAAPAWPTLRYAEGNRLDAADSTRFRYNARNHLAAIERPVGPPMRFEYDSMDMLVRVSNASGCAVWEAEKDGLCRRIAKIVDGARTEYFWDGDRLAAEIAPDGRVRLYLYPDSGALLPFGFLDYTSVNADPREAAAYFVFHDQVGLPLLIEDAAGRVAWRAVSVDPYGVVEVAASASVRYDIRFPGHVFDPETGLHDNRFRTYSPDLGRYLQSDPAGQSGGVNLYAYPGNPLVNVDVLGLEHDGKANPAGNEEANSSGPSHEDPHQGDGSSEPGKSLSQMTPEELQQHCAQRADSITGVLSDREQQGVTVAVAVIQEGDDPSTRRVIVTSSTDNGDLPPKCRPELGPGETVPQPADPTLATRVVKNEDGRTINTVQRDENGNILYQDGKPKVSAVRDSYEIDPATRQPVDRDPNTGQPVPYGEDRSDHHAEQRAQNAVDNANNDPNRDPNAPPTQIVGMAPSRPCCPGCQNALGDNLNTVPPDRRGD
jgi:RHS repeat-associated protein